MPEIFIKRCPRECPYIEGCEGGSSCILRKNEYHNGLDPRTNSEIIGKWRKYKLSKNNPLLRLMFGQDVSDSIK